MSALTLPELLALGSLVLAAGVALGWWVGSPRIVLARSERRPPSSEFSYEYAQLVVEERDALRRKLRETEELLRSARMEAGSERVLARVN